MSAEAWRELGVNVKRAGMRLGRVGSAYAKKHPILVLGGGALLGVLAVWRPRRPAPLAVEGPRGVGKLRRFAWRLLRMGGVGLARAFSLASRPAEKPESVEQVGAGPSNGRTQG